MDAHELGTFSDILFYLERRGIEKDDATALVMQVFGWGINAAFARLRTTAPVPDDFPKVDQPQLSLIESAPAQPKAKRRPKNVAAHRIPEDYAMTPEHRAFAVERAFTPAEIESMWLKFKNHFLGNTEVSPDWSARWRNWVIRGVEYKNRDSGNSPNRNRIDDRL